MARLSLAVATPPAPVAGNLAYPHQLLYRIRMTRQELAEAPGQLLPYSSEPSPMRSLPPGGGGGAVAVSPLDMVADPSKGI